MVAGGIVAIGLLELGVDTDIDHVTHPGEIVSWGVMATPALVVDGTVVLSGRVPSTHEVAALLRAG